MKKRVLSLLLACFMVVSTFIISRPVVDVHAVEAEALETWNLPTDWTTGIEKDTNGWDMPYNGVWKLLGYTNLDTATPKLTASSLSAEEYKAQALKTGGHGKLPGPYLATNANETAIQTTNQSIYDSDGWYVNWNQRWSGKVFGGMATSKGNGIHAIAHANKPGAITFTAPSTGIYSYSENVEQILFLANSVKLEFEVTVRKNGKVLTSFLASESNKTATLAGDVYLETGDKLMFAFEQTTGVTFSSSQEHKSNDPNCLMVTDLVVKKTAAVDDADVKSYDLPLTWLNCTETDANGWSIPKQGQWYLTHSGNLSGTASTGLRSDWTSGNPTKSPRPWYNGGANVAGVSSWYINPGTRWDGVTIFNMQSEGKSIRVIPSASYNPSVVFTAPEDGVYYYDEMFTGVDFYDKSKDTTYEGMIDANGVAVEVLATVSSQGVEYKSFNVTDDNREGSLVGKVNLKAGQQLVFTFDLTTAATIENHDGFLHLTGASVAKIADLPAGYKGNSELVIEFDETFVDTHTDKFGMVKPMGYSTVKGLYDDTLNYELLDDGRFIVWDSDIRRPASGNWTAIWTGNVNGTVTGIGGHYTNSPVQKTTGSALEFTAPYDGTFNISATMSSGYFVTNKSFSEYSIIKENGDVIVSKTNEAATSNGVKTTVSALVTLAKGEKVYVVRKPIDNGSSTINQSCEGTINPLTITAMDHVCSSATVKHITAVTPGCEDGNIEYWACPCGINYADADATTEVIGSVVLPGTGHADSTEWGQSTTQHWMFCGNGCGELRVEKTNHTWENGVCSVCEYECKHENANVANCVSASVCPVCSVELAPINPSNHALPNSVHANGDGTHRHVRVCCDASSVVTEDCAYDENGICVECGFDGSTLIKIENNIDNAFDNAFNDGNNNVTATGPSAGALDDYKVVESATPVAGAQYVLFNLYANLTTKDVYLRHHFVVTDANVQITVNGNPVTEKSGDNVYYYDSTPVLGKYDVADTIVITDGTNTATYSVSLYSYIKSVLYDEDGLSYDDKGEETVAITAAHKDLLKALYDANEEAKKVEPVYVAMANQTKNQIQIYDLNAGNLNTPVWTYNITVGGVSGFRLREYNGDTVLLVTVGTKAEMYNITTGQRVWYTTNTPDNSHCIEILPNGIIAVGGTVGHDVHFYNLNGDDPTEILYEHPLNNAHGLLWDPDNNVLWATGHIYLQALNVTLNAGGTVTVEINEEITAPNTPEPSTHDLQPYFGNKDLILVSTTHYIYVYNKVTKTYTELVEEDHVKGVSVLENGDILYIYPDGLEETWNSTWINKLDVETGALTEIHSNQGRFYKLLVCNVNYQ